MANARVNLIRAQNAVEPGAHPAEHGHGHRHQLPDAGAGHPDLRGVPTSTPERLVTEALSQRPEYRQARPRSTQEDAPSARPSATSFPTSSAAAQLRHRPLRLQLRSSGASAPQLQWSIFDGGNRHRALQGGQGQRRRRPRRGCATPSCGSGSEVEQAYVNRGGAEERIVAARKAVESAAGELPPEPGPLRRRRRDHHRAHRRPARPHPGADPARPQALSDYRIAHLPARAGRGRR